GEALRRSGVLSAQEHDVLRNKARVSEATIQQLEAELAQARVNLEYTTLRAPTDGVVLAKLKEVGEIAVPGGFSGSGDLIRIANLSDLRAEVDVNEADLQRVRMGGPAEVVPDAYPDALYPAKVVKLYPQVDRQKGTLKVEVGILEPDARLLPDMSARVSFLPDPASAAPAVPAVLVPASAVRREGTDSFVWAVRDGRARKVRVETSGSSGEKARVVSGLEGGESVVVGEVALREGGRVAPAGGT
ncbi:efflux RND transporter periplasmic adaptor subunit, partial [bacterium]|nr:efflux RND transporter periplasmic adaptor subunit [bacterium]